MFNIELPGALTGLGLNWACPGAFFTLKSVGPLQALPKSRSKATSSPPHACCLKGSESKVSQLTGTSKASVLSLLVEELPWLALNPSPRLAKASQSKHWLAPSVSA